MIPIDDFGRPWNPWFTLPISGFEDVDSVFVSHTLAGLAIDTIVLDVDLATPIPEPSTALLIALGLCGLSTRAARGRAE
jgi:hypothetical protein